MTKKEEGEHPIIEYYGNFHEGIMIEPGLRDNQMIFMVADKDTLEYKDVIEREDDILVPPQIIPYNKVILPEMIQVNTIEPEQVLIHVIQFIKKYVELPRKKDIFLTACWVLCTWTKEMYTVFPYLHFIGPKGSGKTRSQEVLKSISYRGLQTSSPTEAAIAYSLRNQDVTLFVDEQEFEQLEAKMLVPILDSGYKKGQYYMRCGGDGMRVDGVKYLKTWGFKSFSSRDLYIDMMESRCITISMKKCSKPVIYEINQGELDELLTELMALRFFALKNRWFEVSSQVSRRQFRSVGSENESVEVTEKTTLKSLSLDSLDSLDTFLGVYNNSKASTSSGDPFTYAYISSRKEELYLTLSKIVSKVSNNTLKIIQEILESELEIEHDDEATSPEAIVLNAAVELIDNGYTVISSKDIVEKIDQQEYGNWSSTSVTRILKRMDFKQKRGKQRYWIFEGEVLDKLKDRYLLQRKENAPKGLLTWISNQQKNVSTHLDVFNFIATSGQASLGDLLGEFEGFDVEAILKDLCDAGKINEFKCNEFEITKS